MSENPFKWDLIRLAATFEKENNASSDLQSWLPNFKGYKYPKDIAVSEVLHQASTTFAALAGYEHTREEYEEAFDCPFEQANKKFEEVYKRPLPVKEE